MNDFLRPCNCVAPSDEECEKCAAEAEVKKPGESDDGKVASVDRPAAVKPVH